MLMSDYEILMIVLTVLLIVITVIIGNHKSK